MFRAAVKLVGPALAVRRPVIFVWPSTTATLVTLNWHWALTLASLALAASGPGSVTASSTDAGGMLVALERWKARHAEAAARLAPEDVLVDAMRGRYHTWTRIRVNLRHVPEEPLQPVPMGTVFLADEMDVAIALRPGSASAARSRRACPRRPTPSS